MKVTDIRVTRVDVPFGAPFWWTGGPYSGASTSIIEVHTDDGLLGLDEAPGWHFEEVVKDENAPTLIGAAPVDPAACQARCVPPYQITANTGESAASVALGVVELALWNVRGKALDMWIHKLPGGVVRHDIPLYGMLCFPARDRRGGGARPRPRTSCYITSTCATPTPRPCSKESRSSATGGSGNRNPAARHLGPKAMTRWAKHFGNNAPLPHLHYSKHPGRDARPPLH